jgi:hypothetical protein
VTAKHKSLLDDLRATLNGFENTRKRGKVMDKLAELEHAFEDLISRNPKDADGLEALKPEPTTNVLDEPAPPVLQDEPAPTINQAPDQAHTGPVVVADSAQA